MSHIQQAFSASSGLADRCFCKHHDTSFSYLKQLGAPKWTAAVRVHPPPGLVISRLYLGGKKEESKLKVKVEKLKFQKFLRIISVRGYYSYINMSGCKSLPVRLK